MFNTRRKGVRHVFCLLVNAPASVNKLYVITVGLLYLQLGTVSDIYIIHKMKTRSKNIFSGHNSPLRARAS